MTLHGTNALVTGASRGFGHAIAAALRDAGADVVGLARTPGDGLVAADAADPVVAGQFIERYRPRTLVLNAGAAPLMRPIQQHTWESFSRNWEVDVRQAFHWIREALLLPLPPESTVVVMSSGAALFGSPLSGGYAGAKAAIRFVTGYAADESARAGLGIRFVSVLPRLTPSTGLGADAVAAYAAREGMTVDEYLQKIPPGPTPEQVGAHLAGLASSAAHQPGAYVLTPDGLTPAG